MEPPVTIRALDTGDLAAISDLGVRSKASWGYSSEEMSVFASELTHGTSLLEKSFCARVAVDPSGNILGYFSLLDRSSQIVELDYFFVSPEHFGNGIGTRMMEAAFEESRARRARKMTLISDPNAAGFYEKFGFRIVDHHQSSIAGRSIPIMEKVLS
ncbi:MAG: GNAT family N-acetyltransferase [Verrucomicrobiales bacterium]|nr:GNAT family N-acetyltransferase [Verrucomicrobiales bacterium]